MTTHVREGIGNLKRKKKSEKKNPKSLGRFEEDKQNF